MSDRQQSNLDFLLHKFLRSSLHISIQKAFDTSTPEALATLLRDHKGGGVSDLREIGFRKSMDEWLGQVGLLYLAWICGYIPDPATAPEFDGLRQILSNEALRAYYEVHYPIAMPWLLRLQLEGGVPIAPENAPGAFERFSVLYERFRSDADLLQFLDFLDGFWYGTAEVNTSIQTVVNSFENPDRVAEAFGRPVDQLTRLDRGIVGLVRFLTFCHDLDNLLRACQDLPRVQSAFWFFYAYWFKEYKVDVAEESLRAIDKVIDGVEKNSGRADTDRMSAAAADRKDWKEVMERLTGTGYSKALLELLQVPKIEFMRPDSKAKGFGFVEFSEDNPSAAFFNRFQKYDRVPKVAAKRTPVKKPR